MTSKAGNTENSNMYYFRYPIYFHAMKVLLLINTHPPPITLRKIKHAQCKLMFNDNVHFPLLNIDKEAS